MVIYLMADIVVAGDTEMAGATQPQRLPIRSMHPPGGVFLRAFYAGQVPVQS